MTHKKDTTYRRDQQFSMFRKKEVWGTFFFKKKYTTVSGITWYVKLWYLLDPNTSKY
jgi:hypothetical protein